MTRKFFFLEENPKILVISKFQRAPIFEVEFETAKEPFLRCAWNVADQKNGMSPKCKIYPVKTNEYSLPKAKI